MKLFFRLSITWITYLLLFGQAGLAAEVAHEDVLQINPALSLKAVLAITVKHQPQQAKIQSQQYQVKAKQALADGLLPSSPAITLYHQNDMVGSGRNERDLQATLGLPIWLPNQREARAKLAEAVANNVIASTSSLTLLTAGLLRDALWDIQLRTNELALVTEKKQSAMLLQEKVRKAVAAGESAKTDLLLAEQDTLLAANNQLLAEAELMHAKFRYQNLTGITEIPLEIAEEKSSLTYFDQSPVWLEAQSKVAAATQARSLAQIEKNENLDVYLNLRRSQGAFDQQYNHSLGFSVRIPINTEASTAPIIANAEMALGDAMSALGSLKMTLEAALHEADHTLEVNEQEIAIAKQHHTIAQESLRLAEKAYFLGESDLTTLLRIRNQAFDASRNLRAIEIQHQWHIARYNQAVGALP